MVCGPQWPLANGLKNNIVSLVVKISKLPDKRISGINIPWNPPSNKRDAMLKTNQEVLES